MRIEVAPSNDPYIVLDAAVAILGHPYVVGSEEPIVVGVTRDARLLLRLARRFERRWSNALEAPAFPRDPTTVAQHAGGHPRDDR